MSQPPDDPRRLPGEPDPSEGLDAADEATVQWRPPAEPPAPVEPAAPVEPPAEPAPPAAPIVPSDDDAAAAAAAASPLLSSSATPPPAPTVDWQQPTSQAAPPIVGWQVQEAGADPAPVEGYVIAGPWARLVAWLIDSLLVTIFPSILSLVIVDWGPLLDAMVEQAQDPTAPVTTFMPVTVEAFIVTMIGVGISYLYFVGFWTGPWQATPGMRLLRLRVGDEHRGAELSLVAATKRWFAMGAWLGVLAYVGAFAAVAGFAGQLLQVLLFISVIVNTRRQGLHDRFAGSLVIRERASGDSAVVFGCAILVALLVLVTIVFAFVFFTVVWPVMEPLMEDLRDLR